MAGKNKGGREIRKPKQEKKPKAPAGTTTAVIPPSTQGTKRPSK